MVAAASGVLGPPMRWLLRRIERTWHEQNVMHDVSLTEPEEDDYLLLHIWSALTVGLSSGLLDEAEPYVRFDSAVPAADRRRIMGFYRDCVQRHLHARSSAHPLRYLAKNPALTPKIATVDEYFPDARFICLVRNPLEAIPSFVSMMEFSWQVMGAPSDGPRLQDFLIRMARHFYGYPVEMSERLPEERIVFVDYDRMISDPEATVSELYDRLGFDVGPEFADELRRASDRAGAYRSRHAYDLESLGLDRQRIIEEFADVFERFGFPIDSP
jgi:hypothetical protein